MKPQGRLGDKSFAPADAHGCPICPHPVIGPAVQGSPNVTVNSLPAVRVGDSGIHAPCCGPNMWKAAAGSATVFINGKPAHRMGDKDQHCGGSGKLIQGSSNVLVGDSGAGGAGSGCDCNLAQMRKDAAKKGSPFVEKVKNSLEMAKENAKAQAKIAAKEFTDIIKQGRQNAKQAAAKAEKKVELKEAALGVESKQGYADTEPESSIKVGINIEKKVYDNQLLYYGNENSNVKIGHVEASESIGYSTDLSKGGHEIKSEVKVGVTALELEKKAKSEDGMYEGSAKLKVGTAETSAASGYGYNPDTGEFSAKTEAKARVALVEAELKGSAGHGLVEGTAKGEALSASVEAETGITVSDTKVEAVAKLGAEANLIKGEAEGKVSITPKTVYDNTIGSFIGWINPKSKYKSAPDYLDHGIVIGAKGEAGIGAAAKAEAKAGVEDGVAYAEAGIKLGAGPMAGLKLFFGVK